MWARKGNKQIAIELKDKANYLALGYTIKDDKGKTIAKPEDSNKAKIVTLEKEITTLKKENSTLKGQITVLKKVKE